MNLKSGAKTARGFVYLEDVADTLYPSQFIYNELQETISKKLKILCQYIILTIHFLLINLDWK